MASVNWDHAPFLGVMTRSKADTLGCLRKAGVESELD